MYDVILLCYKVTRLKFRVPFTSGTQIHSKIYLCDDAIFRVHGFGDCWRLLLARRARFRAILNSDRGVLPSAAGFGMSELVTMNKIILMYC